LPSVGQSLNPTVAPLEIASVKILKSCWWIVKAGRAREQSVPREQLLGKRAHDLQLESRIPNKRWSYQPTNRLKYEEVLFVPIPLKKGQIKRQRRFALSGLPHTRPVLRRVLRLSAR
jgi:hypothetical protein